MRYYYKKLEEIRTLIPTRKQWKSWSLPSRLTAIGTLAGVLSFGAYLLEKGYPYFSNIPFFSDASDVTLVVEFQNNTNDEILLYGRGETFYWFPGGGTYRSYAFEVIRVGKEASIVIAGQSKVRRILKLLPQSIAQDYLSQGHMSLSLLFTGEGGWQKMSPSIGFSKSNINDVYIPIQFSNEKP